MLITESKVLGLMRPKKVIITYSMSVFVTNSILGLGAPLSDLTGNIWAIRHTRNATFELAKFLNLKCLSLLNGLLLFLKRFPVIVPRIACANFAYNYTHALYRTVTMWSSIVSVYCFNIWMLLSKENFSMKPWDQEEVVWVVSLSFKNTSRTDSLHES